MKSLTRVIGSAPSEMILSDLLNKLSLERDRVRRTLQWYKENKKPKHKTKAKSAKTKTKKLSTLARKAKASPEDIAKAIALLKKEKGL